MQLLILKYYICGYCRLTFVHVTMAYEPIDSLTVCSHFLFSYEPFSIFPLSYPFTSLTQHLWLKEQPKDTEKIGLQQVVRLW